jgi:predicted TIM-barrel enzyme
MFVGDSTHDSRGWKAALDRLEALNPKHVVAGHKKTGAPDKPEAIKASKQYLSDFGTLIESGKPQEDIYDEMTER